MIINKKIKPLLIPRNKADPVGMGQEIAKSFKRIDQIFKQIKVEVRQLLDTSLAPQFKTNALGEITSTDLAELLETIQRILDRNLLSGAEDGGQLWIDTFIDTATKKGTQSAVTDLTLQSETYRNSRNLGSILFNPQYMKTLSIAHTANYATWKGVSAAVRKELAEIITEAIFNGDNVKVTARNIKERLNVSNRRAKLIAQTEQLAAYRRAEWAEAEEARKELGLNTKLLHFSALKPTTRLTHAARHGRYFDVDEVKEWYSKDGNRFNCYCKQSVIVLNKDGKSDIEPLLKSLSDERGNWVGALRKKRNEEK